MPVHPINPSHLSSRLGVMTPPWLFVLAGATPASYGTPRIADESPQRFEIDTIEPGDVVGIGIRTADVVSLTRRKDRRVRDTWEPGEKGEPEIKRPPDSDMPEFDSHPDAPTDPAAPTARTCGEIV